MDKQRIGKLLVVFFGVCLGGWITDTIPQAAKQHSILLPQSPSPTPTPKAFSNGSLPVVSPSGSRIAFISDRNGGDDVYVISVDGRHEKQITHAPNPVGNVAWARAGKILFTVFKDGVSHLNEIDADGNHQRELANVPARGVTLSPDGRQLLYMAGTWTASKLTISAPDGSNPREITDGSSIAWNSKWSPDGKQIAFTGRNDPKSELAVFVMNADGSRIRQLTNVAADEGGAQVPAWSPNGGELAFQVNSRKQKGLAHVWVVDLRNGAARKLAAHTESYLDETPSWFPDGKRLVFQSNRTGRMEVWVMNADGTGAHQVTGKKQ